MGSFEEHWKGFEIRYLKCTYTKGMGPKEYIINFSCPTQNWCYVRQEDVVPSNEKKKQGYVKCVLRSLEKNKAVVWINDTADHRPSPFKVPLTDLVSKLGTT